ncbi:DUF5615 family PIN-like protein [Algoriphagus hitonicola]|uniref:Predicted nuclease, contains PIN domain, potential toxin-antitoxin system component n=1 Tax=Algoriphagus hitonicola TaxID=435880 RepID=A0A1I2NS35_9BACT|nr:Predicted nuclease, contains PIN domain, potential toxin-antitoxin system component [Algoriphagus hitonicola]
MKFLLDANLPPSLADDLIGHNVNHVLSFPKGTTTSDTEINDYCSSNDCILITKDSDFYDSFILHKKPPKLILVKLGNLKIKELRSYFRKNRELIESLISKYSLIILTPESIKLI